MALTNANFDGILTFTIAKWLSSNLSDWVSSNVPFFDYIKRAGGTGRGQLAGTKYVEPCFFPTLSGPQVEDIDNPWAEPSALQTTGFSSLEFERCEKEIDISVALYDIEAQSGETEKVNLVEGVTKQNMTKVTENLKANLWAIPESALSAGARTRLASIQTFINGGDANTLTDGATPAELATQLGLRAVVSASGATAVTTVGGMSRATTGGGRHTPNVITASIALSMQTLSQINSLTYRGNEAANLAIMHRDSWDRINNFATFGGTNGGLVINNPNRLQVGFPQAGAGAFLADIIVDDYCPSTCFLSGTTTQLGYNIFFLNMKHIKLRSSSDEPQVRMVADPRPLKRWRARWTGQLTSDFLGRIHSRAVNVTHA